MIGIPDIVTLKVQIGTHKGIALAEKYPTGNFIILDRIYNTLSDVEVEVATKNDWEVIVEIITDWGETYKASISDKEC